MFHQITKSNIVRNRIFLSNARFFHQNYNSLAKKPLNSQKKSKSLTSTEAQKIQKECLKLIEDTRVDLTSKINTQNSVDYNLLKKKILENKEKTDLNTERVISILGDIKKLQNNSDNVVPKYPAPGSIYDPYAPENKSRTINQTGAAIFTGCLVSFISNPYLGIFIGVCIFPKQYPYKVKFDD